jgi:anti-anti-sigma factor
MRRMLAEATPAFAATTSREGDSAVLTLEGEFDFGVEERARAALEQTRDARVLVIDLRELTFMDSSGVHLLLEARDLCHASGRMLLVVPGPPMVQRGLAALDLESEFLFVEAP